MMKRFFQNFYLVLIMIFLYAPILIMMGLSFNASKSRSQWGGFTLRWYLEMFQDAAIMEALYNTLLIAFVSALAASVIGTAAALGINSMKRLPKTLVMGVNNIPMLNSDIVTRHFPDAGLYRFRHFSGISDDSPGPHQLQRALCHLERHA